MKPLLTFLVSLALSSTVHAEPAFGEQRSATGIKHSFLICGPRSGIVDENSQRGWES